MKQAIAFISHCGLDVVLCALLTTILTGFLKLPLKKLAAKSSDAKRFTKYITLLPIIFGFGLVVLYTYFENATVVFEERFFSRWLSSVSLSLAIYAFWEKFVPSRKKILTEEEISLNRVAIREIENLIQTQSIMAIETTTADNRRKEMSEELSQDDNNDVLNVTEKLTQNGLTDTKSGEDTIVKDTYRCENTLPSMQKIILRGRQNVKTQ